MIAFLIFLALLVALIVGGVFSSVSLYTPKRTKSVPEQRLVALKQEVFGGGRFSRQQRRMLNMGVGEFLLRLIVITMAIVALMLLLIIAFFNAPH